MKFIVQSPKSFIEFEISDDELDRSPEKLALIYFAPAFAAILQAEKDKKVRP